MPLNKPFRLQKKKNTIQLINSIISAQIEWAISLCNTPVADAEFAVHEIRKTMKRLRAILHFTRFVIGEERFNAENNRLREVSYLLTSLRKSAAHISTFNAVAESYFMKRQIKAADDIKNYLISKKEEEYRKLSIKQNILAVCLKHLSAIKAMQPLIVAENFNSSVRDLLLEGLKRTYKTGRKRLQIALTDSSTANNHNFRKSVKYFWYQLQLLKNIWPGVLGKYILTLDKIGEKLGIEHDLAELAFEITENKDIQSEEMEKAISAIEIIRKKYQQQAWPLSEKVYAESPGAFARRMEAYWKLYFEI